MQLMTTPPKMDTAQRISPAANRTTSNQCSARLEISSIPPLIQNRKRACFEFRPRDWHTMSSECAPPSDGMSLTTTVMCNPDPTRCSFFVKRKARFCRMQVVPGKHLNRSVRHLCSCELCQSNGCCKADVSITLAMRDNYGQ